MKHPSKRILLSLAFMASLFVALAQPAHISITANQPAHPIPPTLWGVFFEDINMSADGGIYPELVRNRSFEDGDQLEFWKFTSAPGAHDQCAIDSTHALNPFNRRSLRVTMDGPFTLSNEGYWGMNIVKDQPYTLRLAARAEDFSGPLRVRLVATNGQALATGEIDHISNEWKYQSLELVASGSEPKAKLEISASGKGTLFLDMVSLLPNNTWNNHPFRPDLAEALHALRPAFMRFPGGCWVEGETIA